MYRHMGDLQHVGTAETVPGIKAAILAQGNPDAHRPELGNARQATPARIGVMAALERDVDQGIGNHRYAGLCDQGE